MTRRLSGGRFHHPQVRIAGHESGLVDRKLRDEFPTAGLVAVTSAGYATVRLSQRFESEIGKAQPRRRRRDFISDIQPQPADRQQVCRWAEAEVNVEATFYRRDFYPVQAPTPSFINRYVSAIVSSPTQPETLAYRVCQSASHITR